MSVAISNYFGKNLDIVWGEEYSVILVWKSWE